MIAAINKKMENEFYTGMSASNHKISPKLRLSFDWSIGQPLLLAFYSKGDDKTSWITLKDYKVTTPARVEAWLLRTVLRTQFTDYLVSDTRYECDFAKLSGGIVRRLFNTILMNPQNKSWLLPLQELLLTAKTRYLPEAPHEQVNALEKAMKALKWNPYGPNNYIHGGNAPIPDIADHFYLQDLA